MNGEEVFRQLIKVDPSAKIIIVSGFNHDNKISALLDEGLSSFLNKPFGLSLLDKTVRKAIDSKEQQA